MPVEMPEIKEPPELVLLMEHLADSPVTAHQIALWTRRDPVLLPVVQALQHGWTDDCDQNLAPFHSRRSELSLFNGCILWGSRVVIPEMTESSLGGTSCGTLGNVQDEELGTNVRVVARHRHRCRENGEML